MLRLLQHRILEDVDARSLESQVDEETVRRRGLLPRLEALRGTHFPPHYADELVPALSMGPPPLVKENLQMQECLAG